MRVTAGRPSGFANQDTPARREAERWVQGRADRLRYDGSLVMLGQLGDDPPVETPQIEGLEGWRFD